MPNYEYNVVPAPKKGLKGKGLKTVEARYANAMTTLMNEQAAEGWDYQRSDTLPCEERTGLRGRNTTFQNMLVFRRALPTPAAQPQTAPQPAPQATQMEAPTPNASAAPHAPVLNNTVEAGKNTAPALGSAHGATIDEAVEVKDPRAV